MSESFYRYHVVGTVQPAVAESLDLDAPRILVDDDERGEILICEPNRGEDA